MLERRRNFGTNRPDVTYWRHAGFWTHQENITGTLNQTVYVMAYLKGFSARGSVEDSRVEEQQSDGQPGTPKGYGVVSEYIS